MEDLIKLAIISIIITIANIYIYIYTEHRRIKTILVFPFTDEQDVQTGRTALIFFFFKGMQKGKPQTKHSEDKLIS